MTRILKDYESMHSKNHHLTRRKALCRLATLPLATLGLAVFEREESPPAHLMKEILAQCTVSVAACWELRKSAEPDDLAVAFNGVCTYLPILQRMVKDSSQYRQEAAELTAQYLLLKSILGQHLEGILEAAQYAQQALLYSRETKNISLQLKALERLAVVYHYSKRHQQALQAIEQAVPLLDQTRSSMSSHVQALTNGMLAVILTRNGQDGMVYLDRAGRFVAEPDSQHLVYVNYEEADLLLQIGYVCYQQGDSTKAFRGALTDC